jgi:YggT family protein
MGFIVLVLRGLSFLILIDALLSWVIPNPNQFPRNITSAITDPIYRPIRKIIDPGKMGGIDISPLIALFGLQALARLLQGGF